MVPLCYRILESNYFRIAHKLLPVSSFALVPVVTLLSAMRPSLRLERVPFSIQPV